MATYLTLFKWTAQGVKNARDAVDRYEKGAQQAEKMGGRILTYLWTQGRYDSIAISEWPDEESYMAFVMTLAGIGNVHSETLRAFSAEEMTSIIKKMG